MWNLQVQRGNRGYRESRLYIPELSPCWQTSLAFQSSTGFLSLVVHVHDDPRAQRTPTRVGLFHLNVTGVELDENQG